MFICRTFSNSKNKQNSSNTILKPHFNIHEKTTQDKIDENAFKHAQKGKNKLNSSLSASSKNRGQKI